MNLKIFLLSLSLIFSGVYTVEAKPLNVDSTEEKLTNLNINSLDYKSLEDDFVNNELTDFNQLPEEDLTLLPEEKQTDSIPTIDQIKNPIDTDNQASTSETDSDQIQPEIAEVVFEDTTMEQVTSVSQLRDVSPTDWAYEALRSLVERYGCIVGYPDATFRGNRALSRYEFAAGLNACMQQMERLIAQSEAVLKEDLQLLNKLAKEFEQELASLRTRIDNVEGRVAFLEDNQFSTTVIMNAEVIFALAGVWGGNPSGGCQVLDVQINGDTQVDCTNRTTPDDNVVLANLTRIGLQSSFTGKDRLRMYLTTGNFGDSDPTRPGSGGGFTNPSSFNTYMSRFGYQAGLNNDVILDILEYRFPAFNDRVAFYASTYGFALSNVLTSNSPFFDIGRGAISRFGQLNPLLRIGGPMDAGLGFDWLISNPVRLQVAYGTQNSANTDEGFFNSDHSTLGVQLLVQPSDNILAGFTYVNAYSSDGVLGTYTGSVNAETGGLWSRTSITGPEGSGNSGFADCCRFLLGDQPAQINAVGGSLQWRMTEQFTVAAWGGYIFTNFLNELPSFSNDFQTGNPSDNGIGSSAGKKPFANAATFTLSLGLSDPFGREGDLLGFIFGMPPKLVDAGPETRGTPVPFFEQVINNEDPTVVTDNNPNLDTVGAINAAGGDVEGLVNSGELPKRVGEEDKATSLHFELFYRFKVSDNIWITPGMFVVTNPGHIADNNTIWAGTVRTTFRF